MVHLENDTFLLELTRMFQKSRSTGTGTLCVTMKKCHVREKATTKGKATAKQTQPLTQSETEVYCLMRAKLHNRKITTSVFSKDVNRFQLAYCNLLKGNMDTLKKVKKTKSKTKKTN